MRCDQTLKQRVVTNLQAFERIAQAQEGRRAAAVALVLVDAAHGAELPGMPSYTQWQDHASLVLTLRSGKLRNHPGQWALPGGRVDAGETLQQTALRELSEEVGLDLTANRVLGLLDDFVTRSGYIMTPVVVWGGATEKLTANAAEVDSIHRIPLTEFMRKDAPLLDHNEIEPDSPGEQHPVLRMPVGETWIAAPTAALLYQFVEVCIRGKSTRVAHFEQPKFAWK